MALGGIGPNDVPPMLGELKDNLKIINDSLSQISKIKFTSPDGAFYAFIDIREITNDSMKWCEDLLNEKGVALVPGEAFSAPGYVRLSFTPDKQTLAEGLLKIKDFIKENQG